MKGKKIEDLSAQEFRGMLDYMASEEFDRMTVAEFFDVLAAMEEEEPRLRKQVRFRAYPMPDLFLLLPAPILGSKDHVVFTIENG